MINFAELKKRVQEDRTTKDMLSAKIKDLRVEKQNCEQLLTDSEKAREIIQIVAAATLKNLEFHISNLVTVALAAVFPNPPVFVAKISIRRNQIELDLLFKEYDCEQKPLDSDGYGAVDVASYALRISFWSLKKTRPVMILDEPFKFVSPDLQSKVSEMIKMISDKLGIQHIMVSHQEDINIDADKTFHIKKIGKKSTVKEE